MWANFQKHQAHFRGKVEYVLKKVPIVVDNGHGHGAQH